MTLVSLIEFSFGDDTDDNGDGNGEKDFNDQQSNGEGAALITLLHIFLSLVDCAPYQNIECYPDSIE